MSRYCADMDSTAILLAADHWRINGLKSSDSMFSTASLWNLENLAINRSLLRECAN